MRGRPSAPISWRHVALPLGLLPHGLTGPANVKRDRVLCGPAIRRPFGPSIHVFPSRSFPFVPAAVPPRLLRFRGRFCSVLPLPSLPPMEACTAWSWGSPTTGCGARGGRGWHGPVRLLFVAGCSLSLPACFQGWPCSVATPAISCNPASEGGILSTQGAEMAVLGALALGFVPPRCQLRSCRARSNGRLVLSYDFSTS